MELLQSYSLTRITNSILIVFDGQLEQRLIFNWGIWGEGGSMELLWICCPCFVEEDELKCIYNWSQKLKHDLNS